MANKDTVKDTVKDTEKNTDAADFYIGVQIELNKKPVNLVPSTPFNKIGSEGLKLKLESPLELGKIKDALPSILNDLSIPKDSRPIKDDGELRSTGVEFLDKVAKKIAEAELTIHSLEYEKFPTPKTSITPETEASSTSATEASSTSKFVLIASATWTDTTNPSGTNNSDKSTDFFKLKGIFIGIAKGYTTQESSEAFLAVAGKMNTKQNDEQKRLTAGTVQQQQTPPGE